MCIFENGNDHKCQNKSQKKYGGFCTKHKREYLVENDKIIYERFTGNPSDCHLLASLSSIVNHSFLILCLSGSGLFHGAWNTMMIALKTGDIILVTNNLVSPFSFNM